MHFILYAMPKQTVLKLCLKYKEKKTIAYTLNNQNINNFKNKRSFSNDVNKEK